MQRNHISYQEARSLINTGDLLLFRRRGLISAAGRSEYNHAAKASWWGDCLFLLEVISLHGGRAVTLSSQVEGWPGQWDVYEPNRENRWPGYNRKGADEYMKRLCGCDYGYWGIVIAALLHLPIVRLFVHPNVDDQAVVRRPPFCSWATVMADRIGGGVDPVPHLADHLTEPSDLGRSPFYRYKFTLDWAKGDVK